MNSINNANYAPNFTAIKFDLSKVTKNKQRWENIARIAEEKAARMSDVDEVIIRTPKNAISIDFFTLTKSKMGHDPQLNAYDNNAKYLMSQSDNYIAKKIVKFLKLARKQDKTFNALSDFLEKINNKDEKFAQEVTDVVVDNVVDYEKSVLSSDAFFKRAEAYV